VSVVCVVRLTRALVVALLVTYQAVPTALAQGPPPCREPNALVEGCLGGSYDPPPDSKHDPLGLVAQYRAATASVDAIQQAVPQWGEALFVGLLIEALKLALSYVSDNPFIGLLLDVLGPTLGDGDITTVEAIAVRACEILLGYPRVLCAKLVG